MALRWLAAALSDAKGGCPRLRGYRVMTALKARQTGVQANERKCA